MTSLIPPSPTYCLASPCSPALGLPLPLPPAPPGFTPILQDLELTSDSADAALITPHRISPRPPVQTSPGRKAGGSSQTSFIPERMETRHAPWCLYSGSLATPRGISAATTQPLKVGVVPGPAPIASLRSFLEILNLGPHTKLTKSEYSF